MLIIWAIPSTLLYNYSAHLQLRGREGEVVFSLQVFLFGFASRQSLSYSSQFNCSQSINADKLRMLVRPLIQSFSPTGRLLSTQTETATDSHRCTIVRAGARRADSVPVAVQTVAADGSHRPNRAGLAEATWCGRKWAVAFLKSTHTNTHTFKFWIGP